MPKPNDQKRRLEVGLGSLALEENVPLAPMTTFRIGGPADFLVRVRTSDELERAGSTARANQIPWFRDMTRQTHSRTDNQSGAHQEKHSLQTKGSDYGPIKAPLLKPVFQATAPAPRRTSESPARQKTRRAQSSRRSPPTDRPRTRRHSSWLR